MLRPCRTRPSVRRLSWLGWLGLLSCALLSSPTRVDAQAFRFPIRPLYSGEGVYFTASGAFPVTGAGAGDYSTNNFLAFIADEGDSLNIYELTYWGSAASAGRYLFWRVAGGQLDGDAWIPNPGGLNAFANTRTDDSAYWHEGYVGASGTATSPYPGTHYQFPGGVSKLLFCTDVGITLYYVAVVGKQ